MCSTVLQYALNLFFLNGHWTWLVVYYFLGSVFMFLMMRVLKFSRPAALLGAVLFMLGPFNIALASEGHGSKLMALSYVPLVFMLTHLLFERKDILSFGLLTAAIGTLALTNHMQIVYYGFIVIGLYLLYHIIMNVRTCAGAYRGGHCRVRRCRRPGTLYLVVYLSVRSRVLPSSRSAAAGRPVLRAGWPGITPRTGRGTRRRS